MTKKQKKKETFENFDFSEWSEAGKKDLNVLRNIDTTKEIKIPIDPVNKKFMIFYVKELCIDEQLRLQEQFLKFDAEGNLNLHMTKFYKAAFEAAVEKTVPPISWKDIKYFKSGFMKILNNILPDPYDMADLDVGGITEEEAKKSDQP